MDFASTLPSPLVAALHRYVEARTAALVAARHALGVNELDARALLYIAGHDGTRPGNLRDYLGITSAGVTTLIDRLVERRAVRRDVDSDDRRISRLTATVDLGSEPWSVLTRFDDAFTTAIADADLDDSVRLADALDSLTASASRAVT
ncbi:helix-turn-helix domain-containing protein [Microbacterium sp. cf046]|uniref:MarR family transcriptional regulator n=1 Tax=Microbacterium sp. cf046 TaxID=1761803 RepID=UPI000A4A7B23|nr:helix-turn-helix domain-containing protein [Microbacterium sp. cf046]